MTKTLTKEMELLALVEDYQEKIENQEKTIKKVKEESQLEKRVFEIQNMMIKTLEAQIRQLEITVSLKENMIRDQEAVIEAMKKRLKE